MKLQLIVILFVFIILLLTYYYNNYHSMYNNDDKINSNLLPVYKLGENKYITSAHYKDYENAIHLLLYSNSNNINFYKCEIKYDNSNDECNAKMQYEGLMNYYRIEFRTRPDEMPLYLYLNNLTIKFNNVKRKDTDSFIVCVSIVVKLKRPLMVIQMIEAYRKFGVSKIVMNYYSSSPDVTKVLNYYNRIGFVDIYQYNDTVDERFREIENDNYEFIYHFQMWKINQCFYEYKTPSNHIIVLDVDEILWPVKASNYKELFNSLPKMDYYFLHQFLYEIEINILNKDDHNVILPDIDIFSIKRYCPTSNGIAHKYIIYNTSKIFKAEAHFVKNKETVNQQYIPNNIAYVRHTRHYDDNLKRFCNSSLVKYNKSLFDYKLQRSSKSIYMKILNKKYV